MNKELIVLSVFELDSFKEEVKLIFIEMFVDVFIISYVDGLFIVGSIIYILLYKFFNKYVVIFIELDFSFFFFKS